MLGLAQSSGCSEPRVMCVGSERVPIRKGAPVAAPFVDAELGVPMAVEPTDRLVEVDEPVEGGELPPWVWPESRRSTPSVLASSTALGWCARSRVKRGVNLGERLGRLGRRCRVEAGAVPVFDPARLKGPSGDERAVVLEHCDAGPSRR